MNTKEAVKQRIMELCKKEGISFHSLAVRSAVSKSTVMNIVRGTNPTVGTVGKLCSGLGITVKEFYDNDIFTTCEED
ncbi:transcriptional regulator with XRE-family HTH domain [Lachnospiraceae bacterium PF1-21]